MTYPLVFKLRTHVPGRVDVWQNLWLLWHTKLAFADPAESIYYTNYLFYPTGTPLIPMSMYNQLVSVPLQYVFPLNVAYNLLFLSSFVIAGTTTFYLVKYLTGNRYAAFVSGVVYAFAPYTLSQGIQGHMEAFTTGWIPLYMLFLFKLLEEKHNHMEEVKSAALAAIGLLLVAASDLVYMMFTIILTGIFIIYWMIANRSMKLVVSKKFVMFCGLFLLVAVPAVYPLIGVAVSGENFLKPIPSDYVMLSADVLSFFVPLDSHPLLGSYTKPFFDLIDDVRDGWARWENNVFIGYTVLTLIAYAFLKVKGRAAGFWKTSFLLTFLLSLGPTLIVIERTTFWGIQIPLPYLALYYTVPFLQNARTIARMDILVMLSAAVLAGYAVSHLSNNWNLNRKKHLTVMLSAIILLESMVLPFQLTKADTPEVYMNISEEDTSIVEVPVLSNYVCNVRVMYYQTFHGKKITGGRLARQPPYVYQLTLNTPLLNELEYVINQPPDINIRDTADIFIEENKTEKSLRILNHYNIRYIILNTYCIGEENTTRAEEILSRAGAEKIAQGDNRTLYRIPKTEPGFFVKPERGWHAIEYWNNGTPARWTTGNATLLIYTTEARIVNLSFTTASYHTPRTLQITLNNKLITETHIPTTRVNITVPLKLQKGTNILRLYTPDPAYRPYELGESEDARKLAFYVQRVEVS